MKHVPSPLDPIIISHKRELNFPFEMVMDQRHETADSALLIHVNPPTTKERYYVTTNFKFNPNGWCLNEHDVINASPMAWTDTLYHVQGKFAKAPDDYLIITARTPYFLVESFGSLERPVSDLGLLMKAINKELLAKGAGWKLEDIKQGMGYVVFVMEGIDLSDIARL